MKLSMHRYSRLTKIVMLLDHVRGALVMGNKPGYLPST